MMQYFSHFFNVPVLVEVILLNLLVVLDRHCIGLSMLESALCHPTAPFRIACRVDN